ncbi:MAG: hypothetical protein ACK40C_12100 [Novosphingobium meiothermophilum]
MSTLSHLFFPIGMLLSVTAMPVDRLNPLQDESVARMERDGFGAAAIPSEPPLGAVRASSSNAYAPFSAQSLADWTWNQVRIEQRMIIRIAPRFPGQMLGAPLGPPPMQPQTPLQPPRFYERKAPKCQPIADIAGVQLESSDRLLLVMRNRKLIGARLDKSCHARDFYSGFYIERSEDGQLCAGRDIIHSRAGANCAITGMRELVPDED